MVACVRFRRNLKINSFQGSWNSMITKSFMSNSTPTCRPNSTLVGWNRSWLCFPMSQEQQEQQEKQPSPSFDQKGRAHMSGRCPIGVEYLSGRYQDCVWFLEGVWKISARCLEGIRRVLGSVWKMSGGLMEGAWKVSGIKTLVSGRCLKVAWKMFVGCQEIRPYWRDWLCNWLKLT